MASQRRKVVSTGAGASPASTSTSTADCFDRVRRGGGNLRKSVCRRWPRPLQCGHRWEPVGLLSQRRNDGGGPGRSSVQSSSWSSSWSLSLRGTRNPVTTSGQAHSNVSQGSASSTPTTQPVNNDSVSVLESGSPSCFPGFNREQLRDRGRHREVEQQRRCRADRRYVHITNASGGVVASNNETVEAGTGRAKRPLSSTTARPAGSRQ